MATLEITVTPKRGGPPIVQQKYQISRELAQEFIDKMEAMVADLPGRHRTRKRSTGSGGMVVDIELNASKDPPPAVSPTFQELFGHRTTAGQLPPGDFGIRYCPSCGERRKFSVERLATETEIACPYCGQLVKVTGWLAEKPIAYGAEGSVDVPPSSLTTRIGETDKVSS